MKKAVKLMVMMLLVAFSFTFINPVMAQAKPYIPNNMVIYKTDSITSQNISLDGVAKKSSVTKLKSSNRKVATVSKFTYDGTVYIAVEPKKPGKTTVSFKYVYKGKTKTAKVPVKVYKYANPVATLKIGGKSYASKFKKDTWYTMHKKISGKITVKAKKGWKIVEISSYSNRDGSNYKSLKNGKKVTLNKGYNLNVDLMDKKTGEYITLTINNEK